RSQIDGSLSASGSLYLVNPNGVTVGPSGTVTTGGAFVASTHDISDAAFNAGGDLLFRGGSTASVINYGTIGSLGGDVALIARKVENAGTITAPEGTVGLAAGYEVLVRDAALSDGKIVVRVGGADTEAKTSGVIRATEVELKANGGNVYALAGNTSSVTKATGVATRGGRIFLTAGDGGTVEVSQTVVARAAPASGKARGGTSKGGEIRVSGGTAKVSGKLDAKGEGAKGGTIVVTAREIALAAGSDLDVSGASGGVLLVGGDYQGGTGATRYLGETVKTARTVTVDAGATLRADGISGAGGKVVVWSDERTSFAGAISARGAGWAAGGDAEVSGKAFLDYRGTADLRSERGTFGNLLLDPYNITISNDANAGMPGFAPFIPTGDDSVLNVTTLINALASANVTVNTGTAGTQAGNITVAAPISWTSGSILTLRAAGAIAIDANITATSGGLKLIAGSTSPITATGAVSVRLFALEAGNWMQNSGSLPAFAARDFRITGGSFLRAAGGTGSMGDGYVLTDIYGLQGIDSSAALRAGYYRLDRDIDASSTVSWNGGEGFNPLGRDGASFMGNLDGAGHIISGLTINRPGTNHVGLFGHFSYGVIKDIGLVGGSVRGAGSTGQLIGTSVSGNIDDAFATGTVAGTTQVGGLIGNVIGGTIRNVYATGAVTATAGAAGGLVGGADNGRIINAYATGTVTGKDRAGGLAGNVTGGLILNAYATGAVSGGTHVGGLVGHMDGGSINGAYAIGAVRGSADVGGLVGSLPNATTVASAYWDMGTTGQATSAGGIGFASANAFTSGTYAGFDFDTGWYMIAGSTRPFLRSEYSTTIRNAHQLQLMGINMYGDYTLGNDIDLSATRQAGQMWSSAGFVPLGTMSNAFFGLFDGAGHVVSNLYVNRPTTDFVGLFGYYNGAWLRNVGLVGGSVTGGSYVGGLVAYTNRNVTLSNAYATGTVSGNTNVGGWLAITPAR
ncbi:GLUG motif-containing protein, partial [Xanthobacteraceae bacterium A53D]